MFHHFLFDFFLNWQMRRVTGPVVQRLSSGVFWGISWMPGCCSGSVQMCGSCCAVRRGLPTTWDLSCWSDMPGDFSPQSCMGVVQGKGLFWDMFSSARQRRLFSPAPGKYFSVHSHKYNCRNQLLTGLLTKKFAMWVVDKLLSPSYQRKDHSLCSWHKHN